ALLHDDSQAAFVAVTRAANLPRLETERLLGALARMRVPCPAVIVDAATSGTCPRCRRAAAVEADQLAALARASRRARSSSRRGRAILGAPAAYPPPRGAASLARWATRWRAREADPKTAVTT